MIFKKIKMAGQHLIPSAIGFPRLFVKSPVFSLRLLLLRIIFFTTNRLLFKLKDPYGFTISNHHMLISYWLFFVENDLQTEDWVRDFKQADQPVAIDVGANAGVFSHMLMTLNPNVKIYAYEPLPDMAESILANQPSTGANITLHSAACGDSCGTSSLYFSDSGDTNASLVRESREEKDIMTVPTVTLDSTVAEKDIFIMKIDTQGYELNVLRGGTNTLAHSRFLILELTTQEELEAVIKHLSPAWKYRKISVIDYLFYH